jgi:hypothetical protein
LYQELLFQPLLALNAGVINMLRKLLHFITYISGEGSWNMLSHEVIITKSVLNHFDENVCRLLEKQLSTDFFMERIPDGRINILRFYSFDDELRVSLQEFNNLMIKVGLLVDGKREVAQVSFYNGYIFSIELKHPRKFYTNKKIEIKDIETGLPEESYTNEIDKAEHG